MRGLFLYFLYGILMRNFLKLIVGVKFSNQEVLSKHPQFIVVANHNSHVDSVAILSAIPLKQIAKTHPVAAGDYFGNSKMKAFASRLFINALLIPRSRPVDGIGPDPIQMMLELLEKGESLILFPEGSRGEPGVMQRFKKGVGLLLEKYPNIPYIPVYMKGMGKILPKGDNVLVPFNSVAVFGDACYAKSNKAEEIVQEIEQSILALQV